MTKSDLLRNLGIVLVTLGFCLLAMHTIYANWLIQPPEPMTDLQLVWYATAQNWPVLGGGLLSTLAGIYLVDQ